jgi:TetR/AcrR family transcriptional regulator, cholesterol catabolism regulator
MDAKQRIVKAALTLMESKGYQGTSVQDIIELANLSKGTFYYYFDSKEDLLYLIHDQFIEYELEKAKEVLEDQTLSSSEKIRKMIYVSWHCIEKFKENVTIFFQEMKYMNANKFDVVRKKREEFENCYVTIIEEGISNGEFSEDTRKKIVSFSIIGMISWGVNWYKEGRQLTIKEIAELQADLILNGLVRK